MYNKNEYRKYNDKKVLHKVKKQWVTVSIALLMMLGGGAVATHVTASANSNQIQPKINRNANKTSNVNQNITNQAKSLHNNLINHAVKQNANRLNTQKVNNANNPLVNHHHVQRIYNVNRLRVHQSGYYQGRVYRRINSPFNTIKINKPIELHNSVNLHNSRNIGALPKGLLIKVNRSFKEFGYYNNYLRYEIHLSNKRNAFITGNKDFVSYVAPNTNYKYYQKRIGNMLKHINSKNSAKLVKKFNKLNKTRKANLNKYIQLYELAYNTQQNLRHPVVVNYHNKLAKINNHRTNIKHNNVITQGNHNSVASNSENANSVASATSATSSVSSSNMNSSIAAPSFSDNQVVIPVVPNTPVVPIVPMSVASNSSSASTNSANNNASVSSASSANSNSSANNSSTSASSSANSTASSASNNAKPSANSNASASSTSNSSSQSSSVSSSASNNQKSSASSSQSTTSSSNSSAVSSSASKGSRANSSSSSTSTNANSSSASATSANNNNKPSSSASNNSGSKSSVNPSNASESTASKTNTPSNSANHSGSNAKSASNVPSDHAIPSNLRNYANAFITNYYKDINYNNDFRKNQKSINLDNHLNTLAKAIANYNVDKREHKPTMSYSDILTKYIGPYSSTDSTLLTSDFPLSDFDMSNVNSDAENLNRLMDFTQNNNIEAIGTGIAYDKSSNKLIFVTCTDSSSSFDDINNTLPPHIHEGMYYGLNYIYNSDAGSVEFTSGTLNWNGGQQGGHTNTYFMGDFYPQSAWSSDTSEIKSIKFDSDVDFSHVTNMDNMFNYRFCTNLPETIQFGKNIKLPQVTSMKNMFDSTQLSDNVLDNVLSELDTSHVTNMSGMFQSDYHLKNVTLPKSFNTSNATDMSNMFASDKYLQSLDLSNDNNFATNKVTNMSNMFYDDDSLRSLNFGNNFNTNNVTNMNNMFNNTGFTTLTLPKSFNVNKVTTMTNMLSGSSDLRNLVILGAFDNTHAKVSDIIDTTNVLGSSDNLKEIVIKSPNTRFKGIMPYSWGRTNSDETYDILSKVGTWIPKEIMSYKNPYDLMPVNYPSNMKNNINKLVSDTHAFINDDYKGADISNRGCHNYYIAKAKGMQEEELLDQEEDKLVQEEDNSDIDDDAIKLQIDSLSNISNAINNVITKMYDAYKDTNVYYVCTKKHDVNTPLYVHRDILNTRDSSNSNSNDSISNGLVPYSYNPTTANNVLKGTNNALDSRHKLLLFMQQALSNMNKLNNQLLNDIAKAQHDINTDKNNTPIINNNHNNKGNNNKNNHSHQHKQNPSSNPKTDTVTYGDLMNHSKSIQNNLLSHLARFGANLIGITAKDTGLSSATSLKYLVHLVTSGQFLDILNNSDRTSDVPTHCRYIDGENTDWLHKKISDKLMPAKSSSAKLIGGWSVTSNDNSKELVIMPSSDLIQGATSAITRLMHKNVSSKDSSIFDKAKDATNNKILGKIKSKLTELEDFAYIVIPLGKSQTVDPSDNIFTDHPF